MYIICHIIYILLYLYNIKLYYVYYLYYIYLYLIVAENSNMAKLCTIIL